MKKSIINLQSKKVKNTKTIKGGDGDDKDKKTRKEVLIELLDEAGETSISW